MLLELFDEIALQLVIIDLINDRSLVESHVFVFISGYVYQYVVERISSVAADAIFAYLKSLTSDLPLSSQCCNDEPM